MRLVCVFFFVCLCGLRCFARVAGRRKRVAYSLCSWIAGCRCGGNVPGNFVHHLLDPRKRGGCACARARGHLRGCIKCHERSETPIAHVSEYKNLLGYFQMMMELLLTVCSVAHDRSEEH